MDTVVPTATDSILIGSVQRLPEDVCLIHRLFERNLTSAETDSRRQQLGVRALDVDGSIESTSFDTLNLLSNAVARRLSEHCTTVGPDYEQRVKVGATSGAASNMTVAIDIDPSIRLVIGLLATMKLGLSYVPVESRSTAVDRIRYVLGEVQPICIVADENSPFCLKADSDWSNYRVVSIQQLLKNIDLNDELTLKKLCSNLTDNEMLVNRPRLMAVLYTSGSTGVPKGVQITHRMAMNRICWQWRRFPFQSGDVGCLKTSLLFVDSISQIFATILTLTPLVIVGRKLITDVGRLLYCLQEHHVTHIVLVPSLLQAILYFVSNQLHSDGDLSLSKLRTWITSGEPLGLGLARQFFDVFPTCKALYNFYGSTEVMGDVTYEEFLSDEDVLAKSLDDVMSIGVPVDNTALYLVDEKLQLVPSGEVGELCASGLNINDEGGYVVDPQHLVSCFQQNPFVRRLEELSGECANSQHSTLYRTGDYARMISGRIFYQGRRDQQVKIQGQRVNMMEVERAVLACTDVARVVVLHHVISEIASVLIAFFTVIEGRNADDTESDISQRCMTSLPEYMRPKLVRVDEIPLQSHTGKIDRMALKELYVREINRKITRNVKEMNETQIEALNILAMNLGMPPDAVPLSKSFFELGGNSVSMIAAIVQLRHHSLHVDIDRFSRASSIHDVIIQVTSTTESRECMADRGEESVQSVDPLDLSPVYQQHFAIVPLSSCANSESTIEMLAECFSEKEPLLVFLGVSKSAFVPFARSFYAAAIKSDLSIAVINRQTNDIVGSGFLFANSDDIDLSDVEQNDSITIIHALFELLESPVKSLLDTGALHRSGCDERLRSPLLHNYCIFVDGYHLTTVEQVKVCQLIESSVLDVAEKNGFGGVVTNNTNPVTQDICEHFLGYETLSSVRLRDFVFDGRKPFAHAPEDSKVKLMVKTMPGYSHPELL